MTKTERVLATLDCRETDRVPIYDLIRNDKGIEHFAGQPIDIDNPEHAVYAAYRAFVDATKSKLRLPTREGLSVQIDGEEYITQRWTEWKVKESAYDHQLLKGRVVTRIRELSEARKQIDDTVRKYVVDCRSKQDVLGDVVVFPNAPGTGCGLYSSYLFCGGLDKFTYFLYDEPELVQELMQNAYQHTLDSIDALPAEFHPAAVVIAEDIGGGRSTLFSPSFLRDQLIPRLKDVAKAYHERGIKVILHSDGNLNAVMDDIVATGIDGLHPIETLAGMDVGDLRARYPKLVLLGGVDCSQLLPFGTPEQVYQVVKDNIRAAKYGYFAGSSSQIDNEVPLENILAMYQAVVEN